MSSIVQNVGLCPLILMILLLACLVQLHDCSLESGTGETEPEADEGIKAASEAYHKLYVSREYLSEEDVIRQLEALEPHFWDEKFSTLNSLTELSRLTDFKEPNVSNCYKETDMLRLKRALEITEGSLHYYLSRASLRQQRLCERIVREGAEQFLDKTPDKKLRLLRELYELTKQDPNQEPWTLVRPAMKKLISEEVSNSRTLFRENAKASRVFRRVREACQVFQEEVSVPLAQGVKLWPDFLANRQEELEPLKGDLFVCREVLSEGFDVQIERVINERYPKHSPYSKCLACGGPSIQR